ncbi:putative ribonuclease H-like domain-containing protein [Tanacetum coccineum]
MLPKHELVLDESNVSATSVSIVEPKVETRKEKPIRTENSPPIIEDWESDSEEENEPKPKVVRKACESKTEEKENVSKNARPNYAKIEFVRPKASQDTKSRGPILVNAANQNLSKAVVLVNTTRPINTADIRPKVNAANQMPNTFKKAHSHDKRPFNNSTAKKNSYYTHRVNTVRGPRVNTARHIVKTTSPTTVNAARSRVAVKTARQKVVLRVIRGNLGNAIKASAYWVWRPKHKGNPELELKERDFKLADENHVLLKVLRRDNMYSVDLKNIVPKRGLTCLYAKATSDEANLWHRRLGHVNFKTINKLVKGNLVKGLPSKKFEINQTCVACQKGKQHRVVPDDFSRFPWVFFLASKDETAGILKTFISGIENLIDLKVKIIRKLTMVPVFKNRIMNEFCVMKGIRREYSVARTPQQNSVAERKNRTLIEAARTMLADSKLPTTFWAEVVNTACYVQNRVLVIKPYNKTPYELFLGRKPALGFMRPFGCLVTIINTLDHLGKFDGKADEGFFVGYSTNSKAFRVLPLWVADLQVSSQPKTSPYDGFIPTQANDKKDDDQEGDQGQEDNDARDDQDKEESVNSINILNAANTKEVNAAEANTDMELPNLF